MLPACIERRLRLVRVLIRGQRFRIVSNVLLEAFQLSGASDNVIKGFRMPHATARTAHFVDLVCRKRFPRMKDAVEAVVIERSNQCVNVIRHYDIFAERIPLPVKENQNAFD